MGNTPSKTKNAQTAIFIAKPNQSVYFSDLPPEIRQHIIGYLLDIEGIIISPSGHIKFAPIPVELSLVSRSFSEDRKAILQTWLPGPDIYIKCLSPSSIHTLAMLLQRYSEMAATRPRARRWEGANIEITLFGQPRTEPQVWELNFSNLDYWKTWAHVKNLRINTTNAEERMKVDWGYHPCGMFVWPYALSRAFDLYYAILSTAVGKDWDATKLLPLQMELVAELPHWDDVQIMRKLQAEAYRRRGTFHLEVLDVCYCPCKWAYRRIVTHVGRRSWNTTG